MIVDPPEVVAVRHRRARSVERQDLEAVPRQVEFTDDLRPQQRDHVRKDGEVETRNKLFGHRRAAEHVPPLEHEHLAAGARQIGGVHQAVMAAADDDDVVVRHAESIIPTVMPIGTPLHERTFALCDSLNYREWSGYYAVSAYETHHEHEYNAIRNAAALIDVSPLFKYIVRGRDAVRFVDRVVTRDAAPLAVGQVIYTPWCDEHGKVIDDGTVTRLGEQMFRWTAADPSLRWFRENAAGLQVTIDDVSEELAAIAVQGPLSARVLRGAGAQVD